VSLVHALAEATRERRPAALLTAINPVDSLSAGTKSCLSLKSRRCDVYTPHAARR